MGGNPTIHTVADVGKENLLATAVDMVASTDSELHLVTVVPGYPSYDLNVPNVVEQLRERAEKVLDEQSEKVEREGGTVAGKHLRIAGRHRPSRSCKWRRT